RAGRAQGLRQVAAPRRAVSAGFPATRAEDPRWPRGGAARRRTSTPNPAETGVRTTSSGQHRQDERPDRFLAAHEGSAVGHHPVALATADDAERPDLEPGRPDDVVDLHVAMAEESEMGAVERCLFPAEAGRYVRAQRDVEDRAGLHPDGPLEEDAR